MVDAFDLGNYVSFEAGPQVKTPAVGDSVSLGLTVGAACGPIWPWVIAPTFGYTPTFQIDPNNNNKGAWNVGMTLGVHVSLIDLN